VGSGSGLLGLKDRVEALGGRMLAHSPPGAGTTLEVRIPADSSHSRNVKESSTRAPG
jgi:signal transduction histidine kinase